MSFVTPFISKGGGRKCPFLPQLTHRPADPFTGLYFSVILRPSPRFLPIFLTDVPAFPPARMFFGPLDFSPVSVPAGFTAAPERVLFLVRFADTEPFLCSARLV